MSSFGGDQFQHDRKTQTIAKYSDQDEKEKQRSRGQQARRDDDNNDNDEDDGIGSNESDNEIKGNELNVDVNVSTSLKPRLLSPSTKAKELQTFFAIFYFVINAGNIPFSSLLRKEDDCHHDDMKLVSLFSFSFQNRIEQLAYFFSFPSFSVSLFLVVGFRQENISGM